MRDIYLQLAQELGEASLTEQGQLRLKVISPSMSPLLRPGDHVLVQLASLASIQRGDLIVTRRENGYLTHRLIAMDEKGWHTKGDRNNIADMPVEPSAIVGLVVAIERHDKLYSLRTRPQRLIGRIQAWLGRQEINCHSIWGAWAVRLISRGLLAVWR